MSTEDRQPKEQVQREIMEIAKYTKAYAANFYGKSGPRTKIQHAAYSVVLKILDELMQQKF